MAGFTRDSGQHALEASNPKRPNKDFGPKRKRKRKAARRK